MGKLIDTNFNFLAISQFTGNNPETDRKNIFYTIKWFCEVFSGDPDVGLILKANHGRGTRIDRQITQGTLEKVLSEGSVSVLDKSNNIIGSLNKETVSKFINN